MRALLFLVVVAPLFTAPSVVFADPVAFYVVSNRAEGNSVVGFKKSDAGSYELFGEFLTGGTGTGDLEIPALKKDATHPLANGDDPLISANAVIATNDRRFVLAVNPGDGTISLMRVGEDLALHSLDVASASDKFPITLAVHGDMVVAASVGEDNGKGSIAAFRIVGNAIEPVEGSRRDLKARPSTIAFSSNGSHVIVNELVTGKIKIFAVEDGTLSAVPISMIDSPRSSDSRFHAIPVGFAVHANGAGDIVAMSEARFLTPDLNLRKGEGEVVQSPLYSWQTGSLSTYRLDDNGKIERVSSDILTGNEIEGGEIANCWVAMSADGTRLWTANALSSSISLYRISDDGSAELVNDRAYKDESEELFFGDIAVSSDGTSIYQLVGNRGEVIVLDIKDDGTLRHRQTIGGLPLLGAYGMLVY